MLTTRAIFLLRSGRARDRVTEGANDASPEWHDLQSSYVRVAASTVAAHHHGCGPSRLAVGQPKTQFREGVLSQTASCLGSNGVSPHLHTWRIA